MLNPKLIIDFITIEPRLENLLKSIHWDYNLIPHKKKLILKYEYLKSFCAILDDLFNLVF